MRQLWRSPVLVSDIPEYTSRGSSEWFRIVAPSCPPSDPNRDVTPESATAIVLKQQLIS